MLLNNLFIKEHQEVDGQKIETKLNLVKDHAIFKGHFPEQPVLPGVCMIQVSKEILESQVGSSLIMKSSRQMKFLQVVNPHEHDFILSKITYDNINETSHEIKANIQLLAADGQVIFKMTANFEPLAK